MITRSYILSQQNTSALIRFEYFNIVLWNSSFFFQKIQLQQYLINILFQVHRLSLNWASNLLAIDSKSRNYFVAHIFICVTISSVISGPFNHLFLIQLASKCMYLSIIFMQLWMWSNWIYCHFNQRHIFGDIYYKQI